MCCVQIKVGIFVAGRISFKGGWSPGLKFLLLCWTHGLPGERRAHSHERLADERTRDKERKTKETGTPHVNTAVSAPHQTNSDRIEQTHTTQFPTTQLLWGPNVWDHTENLGFHSLFKHGNKHIFRILKQSNTVTFQIVMYFYVLIKYK